MIKKKQQSYQYKLEQEEKLRKKKQTAEEIYGMPEGPDLVKQLQRQGVLPLDQGTQKNLGKAAQTVAKGASQATQETVKKAAQKQASQVVQQVARPLAPPTPYQQNLAREQGSKERAQGDTARIRSMEEYQQKLLRRLYDPTEGDMKRILSVGQDAWQKEIYRDNDIIQSRIDKMLRGLDQWKQDDKTQHINFANGSPQAVETMEKFQADQQNLKQARREYQSLTNRRYNPTPQDFDEIGRDGPEAWWQNLNNQIDASYQRMKALGQSQHLGRNNNYYAEMEDKQAQWEQSALQANNLDWALSRAEKNSQGYSPGKLIAQGALKRDARPQTQQTVARALEMAGEDPIFAGDGVVAFPETAYLTDDELKTIAYYAGMGDSEAVEDYYQSIVRDLNARRQSANSQKNREHANQNKMAGTMMNVGGNILSPLALVGAAGQNIKNAATGQYAPVDPNGWLMAPAHLAKDSREGIQQDMGPVGKLASDLGLAAINSFIPSGFGSRASQFISAASAGGQKALDGASRDLPAENVLGLGATGALTDFAAGEMNKGKNGGRALANQGEVLWNEAKQRALASGVSQLANQFGELLFAGESADYQRTKRQLMAQGVAEKQAAVLALLEHFLREPILEAGQGALGAADILMKPGK